MATTRLLSYVGRYWALGTALHASISTEVHHFDSAEVRDWWVLMDPETRIAVEPSHPIVKEWIEEGAPRLSIWGRLRKIFS